MTNNQHPGDPILGKKRATLAEWPLHLWKGAHGRGWSRPLTLRVLEFPSSFISRPCLQPRTWVWSWFSSLVPCYSTPEFQREGYSLRWDTKTGNSTELCWRRSRWTRTLNVVRCAQQTSDAQDTQFERLKTLRPVLIAERQVLEWIGTYLWARRCTWKVGNKNQYLKQFRTSSDCKNLGIRSKCI